MQQDYHRICIQHFPSRIHDGVNIHVVAVWWDFIPQLPMGTQEKPCEGSETGNLAVGKSLPSSENYYRKLFLDTQRSTVVELAGPALAKPWLCLMSLCASLLLLQLREGFTCAGREWLQGLPGLGTSCDSQDRPQEISIKILFHMEELLLILPFHWPMLQLRPYGLGQSKTNMVMP